MVVIGEATIAGQSATFSASKSSMSSSSSSSSVIKTEVKKSSSSSSMHGSSTNGFVVASNGNSASVTLGTKSLLGSDVTIGMGVELPKPTPRHYSMQSATKTASFSSSTSSATQSFSSSSVKEVVRSSSTSSSIGTGASTNGYTVTASSNGGAIGNGATVERSSTLIGGGATVIGSTSSIGGGVSVHGSSPIGSGAAVIDSRISSSDDIVVSPGTPLPKSVFDDAASIAAASTTKNITSSQTYTIKAAPVTTTTTTTKIVDLPTEVIRTTSILSRPSTRTTETYYSNTLSSPVSAGIRSQKYASGIETASVIGSGASMFGYNVGSAIRDMREYERKQIADLNDRFAEYIEKVRFLGAQNRKMAQDLELLRNRSGKDTMTVRALYESEILQARTLIDDTNRQRLALANELNNLLLQISDYRKKYEEAIRARDVNRVQMDDLLERLSRLDAESTCLRKKITYLEENVTSIKITNQNMVGELQKARIELDQGTLHRIDHQSQVQALVEEMEFVRRVHDHEIKELQSMVTRDTTPQNREFFKTELASAIREIRQEYDTCMASNRTDIESWYKLKVQEISTSSKRKNMEFGYHKEEVKRVRLQLTDLRAKVADLESRHSLLLSQLKELQFQLDDEERTARATLSDREVSIMKMKEEKERLTVELQKLNEIEVSLRTEISTYRLLLEGEEIRRRQQQVITTTTTTRKDEDEKMHVEKGEFVTKTSFQRANKGNICIDSISPEGEYVELENTSRDKDEFIGGWKLSRVTDGKHTTSFTFPSSYTLHPLQKVKIHSFGHGVHNPPQSFVLPNEEFWGVGHVSTTTLYNSANDERANYIQTSTHA